MDHDIGLKTRKSLSTKNQIDDLKWSSLQNKDWGKCFAKYYVLGGKIIKVYCVFFWGGEGEHLRRKWIRTQYKKNLWNVLISVSLRWYSYFSPGLAPKNPTQKKHEKPTWNGFFWVFHFFFLPFFIVNHLVARWLPKTLNISREF